MATITRTVEAKLDGINWTNITADVVGDIEIESGIKGIDPQDRIAPTGIARFDLNNSAKNSGAKLGYYTPGHTNCRSGFGIGLIVRIRYTYGATTITKFYGQIPVGGIEVDPGQYGERRTHVTARDWMEQAASHTIANMTYLEDKNIGDVVAAIVANMPIAPLSTSYLTTGAESYPGAFDSMSDGTRAMSEMSKVALSELGYIYIKHSTSSDEILTVESRGYRNGVVTAAATINNEMIDALAYVSNNYNEVKVNIYPRRVDTAYQDLFILQKPVAINAGDTVTIKGTYSDPSQRAKKVAGLNMQTPVVNSDYTFNSATDGKGTDLSAYLTLTATYGVDGVTYTAQNTGTRPGTLVTLKARGLGVYLDDRVTVLAQDTSSATSITAIGKHTITIDAKYLASEAVAQSIANVLLSRYSAAPKTLLSSITFAANKTATLAGYFVNIEPGALIEVTETVTGLSSQKFFVQGLKVLDQENTVFITWIIKPAFLDQGTYWLLGVAGRGEIGTTATLGF